MTTSRICRQCGKPLAGDSPQDLCPDCTTRQAPAADAIAETKNTVNPESAPGGGSAPAPSLRLKYFGDYELLEEIAHGGMGVVWKARQATLQRDVAIKMIRAGTLASSEEVERFVREAKAAANLQHPNIVAIHEIGEHNGQHYFSMDYVAGRDLGALVREGPLPPEVAARYVKIVAEAIHYAHQRGTLHRDLKPQNVLIDAADQPRITDFGLAKISQADSQLTHTGVIMGSPSYMPPEQAAGRHGDVGPASDVYSLGAMLYELLTGRPPFRAATALATLRDVMESEPSAPRRLKPDVPPDLETICLKCLEKMPSARYPSARALAEELERYLKHEPIQARPASLVRKSWSWARHHPGMLAATSAFAMIALGFGVFYLFEQNAFLLAKLSDPTLARVAGSRHVWVKIWNGIASAAVLFGIYVILAVTGRARGLTFKEWFDPTKQARPMRPIGDRMRVRATCVGIIVTGTGVALMVVTIRAFVWEGEPILGQLLSIYGAIFFGLGTLALVIQDYRQTLYGQPARQLTPAQIEPIRAAMEDFDMVSAVRRYREAVPDAGRKEAAEFAARLAESLRPQHPGRYEMPPLSLAGLNWQRMLIWTVIASVILGVIWLIKPPADPVAFAWQVLAGGLFAAGIIFGIHVKGFWKRIVLLVPAMIAGIVSECYAPHLPGEPVSAFSPYVLGFFIGCAVATAAMTRRHRTRSAAASGTH